ncbi:MAG: Release factor glutamine methyltransferase [Chlamydiae bacterium]|nr:Release factor glutamine methyltransferase [Chlamydiota bacterium]
MRNVRELVRLSSDYLQKKGVLSGRRDAEELLAALLKRKRLELYFDYDAPLEEREVERYREWIRRRGEREPLEYIIGKLEFLDCTISVTPGVLIPRQETEILATLVLKAILACNSHHLSENLSHLSPDSSNKLSRQGLETFPSRPLLATRKTECVASPKSGENYRLEGVQILWDLCTGSGCLGLSMKKKCPDLEVTLSDLSEQALACAKGNAEANKLDVTLVHGDLLEPFVGKKADLVLCNPPYVTQEEYETLEDEVRLFEPREALVGGVTIYERLARELPAYLNPGAKVFLEIGATQAGALDEIFDQKCWKQKRCEKDWAGHDRFFFLEFQ